MIQLTPRSPRNVETRRSVLEAPAPVEASPVRWLHWGDSTGRINQPWMPHPPQERREPTPKHAEFLRQADPVLARLIRRPARLSGRGRGWTSFLPSTPSRHSSSRLRASSSPSASTRAIISRLQEHFGGHMPSPAELLAADPKVLRESGFSARKGDTLRALAQRFVDGRLSEQSLLGHDGPRDRSRPDRRPRDRAVDGTRLPAGRPQPTRRVPLRRPGASAHDPARVRDSTTCRPTRSWSSSRIAGGRTGAWPSAICSRRNTEDRSKRRLGIAWVSQVSDRVCGRWSRKRAQRPA